MLTTLLLAHPHHVAAADLLSRNIRFSQRVPDDVIVGRAMCGGAGSTVWLLNSANQLIELAFPTRSVVVHTLRGLRSKDTPWGLACLTDQTLWTLTTPRTLGRMAPDGTIVERVDLQTPSIALFGAGTRLLLESLPLASASAVFTARLPRRPSEGRPWSGLTVRRASGGGDLLQQNLVNCGLASGPALPCWFIGDARVSLSDGVHTENRAFPWLRGKSIDPSVPLHDVAVSGDRLWLLTGSPTLSVSRRVGGPLILSNASGHDLGRLETAPPLRIILAATDASCFLLDVHGDVLEALQP